MKKIGFSILIALMIMILAVSVQAADKTMKVGISQMFAHPFFDTISKGVKSVMEPRGYEVIDRLGEYNIQKQISDVQDFIAQDFDAIFIEPFDSAAIRPALVEAKEAGIPVICLDSPAKDVDLVVANCATDNYDAGVQNAKQIIKDLNGKGEIVVLDSPQATSSLERAQGFVNTLKNEAPDIKIVAQQDYAAQQDKAMEITENILQAHPNFDALFACNENGAFGAIAAMEAVNALKEVLVYSVDGSQTAVEMIKAGKMRATAAQQPFKIGVIGAESMLKYMAGESVPKDIKVPIVYVTDKNVDEYTGF